MDYRTRRGCGKEKKNIKISTIVFFTLETQPKVVKCKEC